MSRERWGRVSELFEAALSLAADEREAFVGKASAGDAGLFEEVRSLLEAHAQAGSFLEPGLTGLTVLDGPLDTSADDSAGPVAGSHVGPWQRVRELGRGGMGVVWLVDRADGGFRQQGALKQVRQGFLTDEMLRRFRRERQILATLEHPNIARLVDGGTTPEGHPYLVMEYVDGRTLYAHCTENAVGLEGRLQLFLTLAEAVQYAHQHLVLHRDLKPSNILVTRDGTLKLLDFGVGKMFADEGPAEHEELRTVSLPLTPEYASPEQIRGEVVGTASDVYSLGVVLYELLTGLSPYPVEMSTTHERMRAAIEHQPERPSTAITRTGSPSPSRPSPPGHAPALRRRLAGDLDTIALKALHKEPSRRYATAEEMAADVRRFLGGRPVRARP